MKTQTNLIRAGRLAFVAAVTPLLAVTASATLTTYSPGDLFIGFRQTGVSNTLVAKIGTTRDFLPTSLGGNRTSGVPYQVTFGVVPGTTTPVTNLSTDLAAVFGTSWATNPSNNSGVQWGIAGFTGFSGTSAVSGLATRSVFVTRGRVNTATQTNLTVDGVVGDADGFAGAFNAFAQGIGAGSYINQESTANSSVAYIGAASNANNWGAQINSAATGSFGLGSGKNIQQPNSGSFRGPTNSVLDLWLAPYEGSTLVTTNTYLGSFTLSANGSLTFTPADSAPPSGVPVVTSASANGTVGVPFSPYTITASNNPTSFSASGLPGGLNVHPTTGLISGTPNNAVTAGVTISASNSAGTGNGLLTLTIAAAPAPTPAPSPAPSPTPNLTPNPTPNPTPLPTPQPRPPIVQKPSNNKKAPAVKKAKPQKQAPAAKKASKKPAKTKPVKK